MLRSRGGRHVPEGKKGGATNDDSMRVRRRPCIVDEDSKVSVVGVDRTRSLWVVSRSFPSRASSMSRDLCLREIAEVDLRPPPSSGGFASAQPA